MTAHRITPLLLAAAILAAPTANAAPSDTDTTFIATVRSTDPGLSIIPDFALITNAKKVCAILTSGGSSNDAYTRVKSTMGLDPESMSLFVGLAQGTYCPNTN